MEIDKKLIDKRISKFKKFMKWFFKQLYNEVVIFIVWAYSMFILLIAIIGAESQKIKMFDSLLEVTAFGVKVYSIAIMLFIFLLCTIVIIIFLNWLINRGKIYK